MAVDQSFSGSSNEAGYGLVILNYHYMYQVFLDMSNSM